MKNNVSILKQEDCCGCLACADVCPAGCIRSKESREGFVFPDVDTHRCVNCGLCAAVCPGLNPEKERSTAPNVIACHAKELAERWAGSSGGVFGVLARMVIRKGGKVWGAAFNERLQLQHVCADSLQNLERLYKSKYLQSSTAGIWRKIERNLEAGTDTLFAGTPCQCAALRNFLKREYANLTVVDIICHGVPNQKLFDDYIRDYEQKHGVKVTGFTFRYKAPDFQYDRGFCMQIQQGGKMKKKKALYYDSPFYHAFSESLTFRPSCYYCPWANVKRTGDITLGDFWEVERYMESPGVGHSAVLLNTQKGQELFESVRDKLEWKVLELNTIIENNHCLQKPSAKHKNRERFFEDYNKYGFRVVKRKYMTPSRRYRLTKGLYFSLPLRLRKQVKKWLMR